MIKKQSQQNVGSTLDHLEQLLKEQGINVVARVDHAAAAANVDLSLRPTQVLFFGNPMLGTLLMQSSQTAGLDLPMRVLAWEDEQGDTWIGYSPPSLIAEYHQIKDQPEVINKMAKALESMTDAVCQR